MSGDILWYAFRATALMSGEPTLTVRDAERTSEYADSRGDSCWSYRATFVLALAVERPDFVESFDATAEHYAVAVYRTGDVSVCEHTRREALRDRLERHAERLDARRVRDAWLARQAKAVGAQGVALSDLEAIRREYFLDQERRTLSPPWVGTDRHVTQRAWVAAGAPLDWRGFLEDRLRREADERLGGDALVCAARAGRLFKVTGPGVRRLFVAPNKWAAVCEVRDAMGLPPGALTALPYMPELRRGAK